MATKITKVRIGSTVYEKEVQIPDPPKRKPSPAPEPSPSPTPTEKPKTEPTLLEKAAEAVKEVTKPKTRRGRPKKSSSD